MSLTRPMFDVEQVQASIFLADASAFSPPRAIGAMLGNYSERFNGELISIPLSNADPHELPRVVLQSQDKGWRAQFSPSRMDVIRVSNGESPFGLEQTVHDCRDMVSHYSQVTGAAVNRLALVVVRRCKVENPAHWLVKRFCNDESQKEPLNRSETFEIHNHKIYKPHGTPELNSWVRCSSATHKIDGPVVVVLQDLNTANRSGDELYKHEDVPLFFDAALIEIDSIFDKYFTGAN